MKTNKIILTVLMDDEPGEGLENEHGFSVLIENNGSSILFDTGQSDKFIHNAEKLGKNLQNVTKVVISHGHYDHIGGLKSFLDLNKTAEVYMKKEALNRKLKQKNGGYVSIGLSDDLSDYRNRFIFTEGVKEISQDVYVSGNIEDFGYKIHNKKMFTEVNGIMKRDEFDDEQFLFIKVGNQIFVISGCSHRGIVNIVKSAVLQSGCTKLKGIIGGFHMSDEDETDVNREIEALKELNPQIIAPCHCTGKNAINKFKIMFPQSYFYVKTGTILEI